MQLLRYLAKALKMPIYLIAIHVMEYAWNGMKSIWNGTVQLQCCKALVKEKYLLFHVLAHFLLVIAAASL